MYVPFVVRFGTCRQPLTTTVVWVPPNTTLEVPLSAVLTDTRHHCAIGYGNNTRAGGNWCRPYRKLPLPLLSSSSRCPRSLYLVSASIPTTTTGLHVVPLRPMTNRLCLSSPFHGNFRPNTTASSHRIL